MTQPYSAGPYARQLMHCPIFHTDFYKIGHKDMEPDGTTFVQANLTPRFSKYLEEKLEGHFDGTVIVAGVQPYVIELRDRWQLNFFDIPWAVLEAAIYEHICLGLFNPNLSIEHMRQLHALQCLPVRIRALLDGTHSKVQVPVVTFENTHPDFEWLPTYLETDSSNHIWPSTTAATLVYHTKQIVKGYFERTGTDFAMYDWLLHDFSARGMMGTSATRLTGVPHLFVSYGTDTVATLPALHYYYGATNHEGLTGHSVRASEHSVTCMYGENDIETFRGWLRKFIDGVISLVSDTHDYWHILTYGMETLHDDILARNGKVVIRPDCYSSDTSILTEKGWKLFTELGPEDKVAQVLDDGSHEFVKPLRIINQEYHGEMHHFTDIHGKVNLLVTPNHRVVYQIFNERRRYWEEKIKEAQYVKPNGNHLQRMLRSSPAQNRGVKLTQLERLRIAFQADGSFVTKSQNSIRFSFSKQRKIDRLKNILDSLELEYKIYKLNNGSSEFSIKIDSQIFQKDLEWVDVSNLCSNWAVEFIDELKYWDASVRNENRIKFDTTVKSVIKKVELIAIAAGYGVLVTRFKDTRKDIFKDVFTANILFRNHIGGQSWKKKIVQYSGTVHCVTVPSGKILVKRKRSVLVSGNSGDPYRILVGYPEFDYSDQVDKANLMLPEWIANASFKGQVVVDNNAYNRAILDGTVETLAQRFGTTTNHAGYKTLMSKIGVIYGDGMSPGRIAMILEGLMERGYTADNVIFGLGSYFYQGNTRDSLGIAVKVTYCIVNGQARSVFKAPKTDDGFKRSAKGLLTVKDGALVELHDVNPDDVVLGLYDAGDLLTVFDNSVLYNQSTLKEVRQRVGALVL